MGVTTALDASVRREGRRIRIHARLFDTGTGYTLWSDSYDREADDVLALQSEIATEVVRALLGVIPTARRDVAPGDSDGIACNLAPSATACSSTSTTVPAPSLWPRRSSARSPPGATLPGEVHRARPRGVVFVDDSPEGPRGTRMLSSDPAGGREKITVTAGNEAGRYAYEVEAYGERRSARAGDQAILIRAR